MGTQKSYLLAFGSTHKALKAEGVLMDSSIPFRLLPAPKEFTRYCDLVISVGQEDLTRAVELIEEAGAGPETVYLKQGDGYAQV